MVAISELDGLVVRGSQPLAEAYVVVALSSLKSVNGWPEFVQTRTDASGRFQLRGLSPGDYRVAVLSPAEWREAQMPGILAAQLAAEISVKVLEADTKFIQVH